MIAPLAVHGSALALGRAAATIAAVAQTTTGLLPGPLSLSFSLPWECRSGAFASGEAFEAACSPKPGERRPRAGLGVYGCLLEMAPLSEIPERPTRRGVGAVMELLPGKVAGAVAPSSEERGQASKITVEHWDLYRTTQEGQEGPYAVERRHPARLACGQRRPESLIQSTRPTRIAGARPPASQEPSVKKAVSSWEAKAP